MDIRKKLGKNVRKLLNDQNLSPERFAYEHQISKGYIYDVVNGEANVTLTMLEKLAQGLKVKPEDLIS